MHVAIVNLNLVAADAIGRCVLNQVRYFRRRGDTVTVYIQHPSERLPEDMRELVRVVTLAQLAAGEDHQFRRSDLYIYHYPAEYDLLETIRGLDRGAVILFYHNVTPPAYWDGTADEKAHLQHSIDSLPSIAYYADLVVTPSEYNADQLAGDYGVDRERIRVLPLAVDLSAFAPGAAKPALRAKYGLDGHPVMLYVGRMAGNKRADLLIDVLARVRERVSGAVLLLVGDQGTNDAFRTTTDRLKAKAASLGVSDAVIFAGIVDDVAAHYRLANVYVSASLHEGFGVPLIEAMASGVPLVVSNASAHPWVAGDAALLCAPGDAADMAAKVICVLTDDEQYGELVQRGLARARKFSLEAFEDGWGRIVAEATAWLPGQPYPRPRSLMAKLNQLAAPGNSNQSTAAPAPTPATPHAVWQLEFERLEALSDIMIRGYEVHSAAPLVGPFIVWFRKNVTSHLREPYVDPMIERQVAFNRALLELMRRLVDSMTTTTTTGESAPTSAHDGAGQDARGQLNRIETLLNVMSTQLSVMAHIDHGLADKAEGQPPAPSADTPPR